MGVTRRWPLSHYFGRHLLWMNPSGVASAGVHPHGMVTGLERLDAPLEEDLQQVHTLSVVFQATTEMYSTPNGAQEPAEEGVLVVVLGGDLRSISTASLESQPVGSMR